MKGTSAVVRCRYGTGRVFCFSPHPELTAGLEHLIPVAVSWLAPVVDTRATEVAEISRIVRRHVPVESPGGVAVLVSRAGQILHRKGYGFVKGSHVTTTTGLGLASVTKQFAAMCAAMLIEEGRLDLQAKVSDYLPELSLPVKGRELLVQDLLWHISGLPNFINKPEQLSIDEFKKRRGVRFLTNETHAEWLATMQPQHAPGLKYQYTNSGYVLLVRIMEVITGEPFHVLQQRRVFDVLGMRDTTDSTRFNGSGNMRTTLEDYSKWDEALWSKDQRLLSRRGYEMLFQRGTLDNGDSVDYGFGWQLEYQGGQLAIARHGGWGSGITAARNMVTRYVADGITVAIFAQEHPDFGRRTVDNKRVRDVVCDEIHAFVTSSDFSHPKAGQ